MAENDGQVTEPVTDAERQAEWARLEGEEGQPAKAPTSESSDEPEGTANGGGQDEQSPHEDPAAAKPAGKETSPANDDLWKDAPEALRAAYEAERVAREKAEHTIVSNTGRLSAESRRAAELEAEIAALKAAKPETKKEDEAPALTEAERKTLEEEFPDVAAPLLKVVGALEAKVAELEAGNASAEERRSAAAQLELQRLYAEEEQKLAGEHSDWRDVAGTPAFADWAKTQPRAIQEALARNANQIVDAAEAGLVIERFKQQSGTGLGKTDERRERQLRGNALPNTKIPGSTTSVTEDREAEWRRLEAIDAAKARKTG